MTLSIAEAVEVKRRVEDRLLALPGVHTVGFGGKVAGGEPTGEFAILVLVLKKMPESQLPDGEVIPEEIEGVKTDVVEAGIPIPHSLDGGIEIFVEHPLTGELLRDVGTLGCFALRLDTTPPKAVLLSNDHVLYGKKERRFGKAGDLVQLTSCSDCCETVIAKLTRTGGPDNQSVDAAIAELEVGVKWLPRVHGIPIVGTLDLRPKNPPDLPVAVENALRDVKFFVKKFGAVTGLTTGVVGNIDGKSETRVHQLQVWSIGSDEFSALGDSGSVIYVDNSKDNAANVVQQIFGSPPVKNPNKAKVVGLLWGGAFNTLPTGKTVHISSCGHIETVTDLLGIKVATNSPEVVYEVGGEPKPHPAWARVYTDLSGTERAKELVTLYGKYSEEIGDLLKVRRHFVVAWHRNHGPKIVRALIDVAESRAPFLPTGFEGRSWSDCVQQIAHALLEEGSSALKADVIRYLPLATRFGGRSYAEVLGFLVISNSMPVAIETGPAQGNNI